MGNNKQKAKTVKMALPNKSLSPNPMGNICINGTIINRVGILKIRFKKRFVF